MQAPRLPAETSAGVPPAPQIDEPVGPITLRDAVALALVNNPKLKAFSLELRAAEARKLQASLLPNPEIEIEVEEFGGTGERARFDSSETSIQLGQLIELAGKRSKRTHLATLERDLVEWNYQSKRSDVMSHVTKTFIDVLAAQEQLSLTKELVHLSEQAHFAVAQRVKAGKDSPVDETKAKVALSSTRIALERASETLASARHRLAATWGSHSPTFKKAAGRFYKLSSVPSLGGLTGLISGNPDIARWAAEKERRRAALSLEKAKANSDIKLGGGLQYFDEGDDAALILGLSIPVPLFNRNQGNISEAVYMLAKVEEDRKAVETNTRAALAEAVTRLSSAFSEITVLKNDVLPLAQSAFDAASQGYREGKFEYLDVLDAQRTLFELRGKYIEALAKYHKARADAERLVGQDLDSVKRSAEAKVEESK
jgi:cobalt-zinc-cadmium efflux system outer membrane protein